MVLYLFRIGDAHETFVGVNFKISDTLDICTLSYYLRNGNVPLSCSLRRGNEVGLENAWVSFR